MYLTIVVSRPESLDVAVRKLADFQGISPYEARNRLDGELPRIVAVLAKSDEAAELMRKLNGDGFVSAVLAADRIQHDDDRETVGSLTFGETEFDVALKSGLTRVVPYQEITRIIHGVRSSTSSTTREEKSTKFSPGRAIMSGGLMITKSTTKTNTSTVEFREGFLYIEIDDATLALYERRTNYSFLGPALMPSSFANFQAVITEFGKRAPHVKVNGRLARPLGLGTLPLPPPGMDPGEWRCDLSVAVLALGMP